MITTKEAIALTANTNNEITKKVDEIINIEIDACIRSEASDGNNCAKYYFRLRDRKDPIFEKFKNTIAYMIHNRLTELGWQTEILCSARDRFDMIGIAIHW